MSQQKPIVRTTAIEAFRRYLANGENDYYEITEQSVIDSVTGEFKGSEYTRIGTAFHSVVQYGEPCYADSQDGCMIDVDDHAVRFNEEQLKIALDYRNEHPNAYHEYRGYRDYGRAIVTGCADMIEVSLIPKKNHLFRWFFFGAREET